ncbi:glycosyltransferase family 4 protein [Aegicerativicinus sediminis]|uniref:glycosyltransferase family 4 protein n=1 Tax=Aegicerativicinus sediminis TaxID=2893202 RepID=UPI001E29D97E|nr:glycosyltransferase [Aegicerativicinus sediminis]
MKKLAVITTHPIQYNSPWFALLNNQTQIEVKVFYTWSQSENFVKDRTFGKEVRWDIPLLKGYDFEFVQNVSKDPGTHHRKGIYCPELIGKVRSFNPSAILVFGWYLKSHFQIMRYFKGKIPIWFRGDSTLLDNEPYLKSFARKLWLTWVYKNVDKAFYVGIENYKYFKYFGLDDNQLVYAPHSVDNQRFGKNEGGHYTDEANRWRNELGLKSKDLVVLFAGKLESKKQPDFLIRSIQKANLQRKRPLKLLVVGNGPMEKQILGQIESDSNLFYLEFQNQSKMPIVYRMGNIFCLPSKGPGETWGLAVNEAMASGISAIVSNKVGCGSDLVNSDVGLMFEYDNENQLVEQLIQLELNQCKHLGDSAQQLIKNWSFQKITEAISKEMSLLN